MNQDDEHLNLLAIFHYVLGGLTGLVSLLPTIHLVIGLLIIFAPENLGAKGEPPPALLGWIFAIIGAVFILFGMVLAGLIVATGRSLAKRRRYTFCLVMAAVECLFVPLGTVLGVFTILVLMRESVKPRFAGTRAPISPHAPLDC